MTSLLPEAVAAIQAQKLVKSPEELNGYPFGIELSTGLTEFIVAASKMNISEK
ncbi:MAG: hypothetical protein HND44_21995 [Chloroflexi bacterium]|nr:hypothetical protein [Ardenticatenaceae bacterium]NOG37215.1 hypothetical protein [Chloroflexota bacterium]